METVTIGCRLPNGIKLEVGYSLTATVGGKKVTQYRQGPEYQSYELLGTNAQFRKTRIRLPSTSTPEPYINRNVPKALWEQWVKEHPRAWAITSGNLFVVKDDKPDEVKAHVLDSMSRPAPMAPLDRSKVVTVGKDTVETAKFDDDK